MAKKKERGMRTPSSFGYEIPLQGGTNSLSKISIFQNLSPEISKKIKSMLETVEFAPGQTIFSQGDPGDALYMIVEGEVEIVKFLSHRPKILTQTAEAGEKLIATLGAGDFFGEMALLEEAPRSATARAKGYENPKGNLTLLKIDREKFWKLVQSDAKIAFQTLLPLAKTLSDRLRQTTLELSTVFDLGKLFSLGSSQKELSLGIISQLKTVLPEKSFASIALYNEFNEEFEWIAVSSREEFPDELKRTVSVSEPLLKILADSRQMFFAPSWNEEVRLKQEQKKLYGSYAGSLLCVPFLRSQKSQLLPSGHWIQIYPLIGFLFLASQEPAPVFDKNFIHLMNSVAQLAAVALESAAYRQEEASRNRYLLERQSTP